MHDDDNNRNVLTVALDFGRRVTGLVVARHCNESKLELLVMQSVHGEGTHQQQLTQIMQVLQPHITTEVSVVRILYENVLTGMGKKGFEFMGKNMLGFQKAMLEGLKASITAKVECVGLHPMQKAGGVPADVGRRERKKRMLQAAAFCLRQGSHASVQIVGGPALDVQEEACKFESKGGDRNHDVADAFMMLLWHTVAG